MLVDSVQVRSSPGKPVGPGRGATLIFIVNLFSCISSFILLADAYREYSKLRRGGNENKDGTCSQTTDQSETWGSHLNKNKTTQEETSSGPQHRKGSLLSKLSQKLYENYSQSKKVSCSHVVASLH